MYMFTVRMGTGQLVYMLDGENIIGLHHKISHHKLHCKKFVRNERNFNISLHLNRGIFYLVHFLGLFT